MVSLGIAPQHVKLGHADLSTTQRYLHPDRRSVADAGERLSGKRRGIDTIDADLRRLSRAWRVARVLCDRMPSTALVDDLLDERLFARYSLGWCQLA